MTPLDYLLQAKARIATEATWCKYSAAVDANGVEIGTSSPYAVRWCAGGSLGAFYEDPCANQETVAKAYDLLQTASGEYARDFITIVNDKLGHEAVMHIYDRAIELALEQLLQK